MIIRRNVGNTFALFMAWSTAVLLAQSKNWKPVLEQKLKDAYHVSKVSLSDTNRITAQGVVLTIAKAGIGAEPAEDLVVHRAVVSNGQIKMASAGSYSIPVGARVYVRTLSLSD